MDSPNADVLELMASATSEPSGKRFSLATVIVPLLVLILTLFLVGGEYRGTLLFSINDSQTSNVDKDGIEIYSQELNNAVWRFAQQNSTSPIPLQWDVKPYPQESSIELSFVAAGFSNTTDLLSSLGAAYTRKLDETAESFRSESQREKEFLSSQHDRLDANITSLGKNMNDLAETLPQHDLVQSFHRNLAALENTRSQYDGLKRTLNEAIAERDNLVRSPTPSVADVPQHVRQAAYEQSLTLVQDLKQLEVQLTQVRSALLKIDRKVRPELNELATASTNVGHLSDLEASRHATGPIRDVIEGIVDKGSACSGLVTGFAQSWTALFDSIQNVNIDETDQRLLTIYRDLNEKVEVFIPTLSELVEQIQDDVRYLTELAASTTAHQALLDAATGAIGRLQAAQRRLSWSAGDINGDHNYILDSALQSARGLLHRANLMRKEIDAELNDKALRQAARLRRNRIDSLAEKIEELRKTSAELVDSLFVSQQELEREFSSLPTYLRDTIDFRVAQRTSDALATEQRRAADLLAEANETRLRSHVNPAAVKLLDKHVSPFPVNIAQLLISGVVAFGLAFLAVNTIMRFGSTRRVA